MSEKPLVALAACIGIDWADDHHDLALQVTGDATIETQRLAHTPAALADWLASLATRFAGQPVGIALETSRGPLVHALLEVPFVVLYPINPRSLHRFREAFAPSGAKDDGPDARLLLTMLVQHRAALRAWTPDDVATRTLRRLVEHRRTAVALRTQLVQQLQAVLKEYFPHALDWAGTDLASAMACAFLQRWPTLPAVQRARPATLRAFYTAHHCRSAAHIDARLAAIQTAVPLTTDAALLDSSAVYVHCLTQQLQHLLPSMARFDDEIAARFAAHPDAAIFASFPGAGAALAPRLLAAFGTDRTRFATAADMQQRAGIAPVTIRSGKHHEVRWRWATSTFVRQTFHEHAQYSLRTSVWASVCYHRLRERGQTHHAAIRALAFKWIRILHRCWTDGVAYDEARYLRALAERGSPLALAIDAVK